MEGQRVGKGAGAGVRGISILLVLPGLQPRSVFLKGRL